MKIWFLLIIFLFAHSPVYAAEDGAALNRERYVADDIEIVTLPNGESMVKLVSKNRRTVRQFWVESVYPEGPMLVFRGYVVAQDEAALYRKAAGREGKVHLYQQATNELY